MTAAADADRWQRFPPRFRLRKRHEFVALQRHGQRHSAAHFVVITRTLASAPARLGVTTSRKVGSAPERNRVRRLVREFFRRHRALIDPPRDVLVIARPEAAALSYADVVQQLSHILVRRDRD